jgi:hypothetical protein
VRDSNTPGPRDPPPPVLVIVGALAADAQLEQAAVEALGERFGGVALQGRPVPFDKTRYYEAEMGPGLTRTFYGLGGLVAANSLVELKLTAWEVEQRYQRDGRRRVNLDIGTLDATRVILASFKSGPQKLYLGQGVWADLVLFFHDGAYGPLPWTFPDLRDDTHASFFRAARSTYKQLKRR